MGADSTPLGKLLKRRREELGYSRTRVAQLTGINANSIESWEVGRVSKPPIHDVMLLARILSIPMDELERVVLDEPAEVPTATVRAGGNGLPAPGVVALPLLERAATLLGWSDADAARALDTSSKRIASLRAGAGDLSVLEVLTLIAVLARFPTERGGASRREVDDLLMQLRGAQVPVPVTD